MTSHPADASKKVPSPGSDAAREQGCKCPRVDNRFGKGCYWDGSLPVFVMRDDCPLHGEREEEDE